LKVSEKGTLSLRQTLVVVQFTISIVLIIGVLIISQQMRYLQSAKLGLNKEQVIVVKNADAMTATQRNVFQNTLLQVQEVKKVATSDGVVGGQNWTNSMSVKGSQNSQLVNFLNVSYDFPDVLGIEMKEGRSFSSNFPADTLNNGIPGGPLEQNIGSIILNETAVKDLGVTAPAVGKQILWDSDADTMYYVTIVGVAKDFHFTSLRNEIKPFAFVNNSKRAANFTIKLSTDNVQSSLAQIENTWKKFLAERAFEYYFLDETYAKLYQSEERFQKVFISLVILGIIIACLGLLGLATFSAQQRVKEIGVRKVIGGNKKSLVSQFLAEALLLSFLSAMVGLLLAKILLPYFNRLSGRNLNLSFIQYPELLWMIAGLVVVVGLLSGSYPALVLSGFKPIEVLKTKVKLAGSNIFTKSLVTLQFVLSAGLIISTVIIMQQLHYMQSKSPGFDKENIVVVDAAGISNTKKLFALFKQELSSHPEIVDIASSDLGLGEDQGWSESAFKYNGTDKTVYEYFVDPGYMHTLGLQLLAGRNFDPNIASDSVNSVIVNETMVRDFGWTMQTAIGQQITGYRENLTPVVIGVVKNFNFFAFSKEIEPQMFQQFSSYLPYKFFVRIKRGDPSTALTTLQASWKKIAPDYPLKYNFLDENLNRFYQSETRWSNIVGWAGGISIFLACLGLLGLAALAVVNRTKEIGIRKVLGASTSTITGLISKDFLKLVMIAFIIAAPLAWWFMNKWLQDYPYRIQIQWSVFVITGIAIIIIALITVSFQAIKAAITNPVKSLRTE